MLYVFSFIIPVYNVEEYLERCLDSIMACKSEDCEVILVTGSSDDRSNEICERYAAAENNVKITAQGGTGLSDARNCGIDAAAGKYIIFIDSDDFVISDNLNNVLDRIRSLESDIDVFVSDYIWVNTEDKAVRSINQIEQSEELIIDNDYIPSFLSGWKCFWNVWRYIYRKDFLIENGLYFKTGYLSEDVDYTTRALIAMKKMAFFHLPYYCYRVNRKGSLMNVVTYKRIHDCLYIFEESIKRLEESDFKYNQIVISKYLFDYILETSTIFETPVRERKKTKELFYETKYLLNKGYFLPGRILYFLGRIGLFFVPAYMLFFLKKLKKCCNKFKGY